MEKFLRGKSFQIQFTLKYKDTLTAIDLDDVTDITVVIKQHKNQTTYFTKKYSTGGVTIDTADSGICSVYIDGTDTTNLEKGQYDYIVTIDVANANFSGSSADFAGYDGCFILE